MATSHVYEKLVSANVPRDRITISRSIVYTCDVEGIPTEVGKIEGDLISWSKAAPLPLRGTSARVGQA